MALLLTGVACVAWAMLAGQLASAAARAVLRRLP